MRYAILSDVHANAAALRAVLTDAADMHAERIICLGDVLGYGPEPVEALELTYRRAHVCLAGNHDDAVAGRYPVQEFTEIAAAAVKRHRAALAQKAIDWLRHLPHTCEFQSADGGSTDGAFACSHGDFYDPKHFDYILKPADALPSWRERTEQLLFVGHTHRPGIFVLGESGEPHALEPMDFALEAGKRYLVNVGSVGYPRSGACRSFYCIYDDHSRTVTFRSLPFDLEGYRAKMNGQGVDEAPWIKTRAQELRPIEIRGTEKFAKPEKKKGKRFAGAKHVVEATLPPLQTAPSAPHRLGPALVIGAAILALGGAWCTVRLVNSLRESSVEHAAVSAVELPAAPSRGEDIVDFADTRRLTSGWIASLQFSEKQDVRQDGNAKTKATVFRLTSETNGVIRFSKTMSLFDRPQKVYYTVKLATTTRPGVAVQFGFASRVRFLDADGKLLSEDLHTAARSVSNRAVKVPPGAETAELWIDCRCIGTFDIDVPLFKKEPVSRRKK